MLKLIGSAVGFKHPTMDKPVMAIIVNARAPEVESDGPVVDVAYLDPKSPHLDGANWKDAFVRVDSVRHADDTDEEVQAYMTLPEVMGDVSPALKARIDVLEALNAELTAKAADHLARESDLQAKVEALNAENESLKARIPVDVAQTQQ